jgi:hypothetical protein
MSILNKAQMEAVRARIKSPGDGPQSPRWDRLTIGNLLDTIDALAHETAPAEFELTEDMRKEIVRLASYPNNGETVAEHVETLINYALRTAPAGPRDLNDDEIERIGFYWGRETNCSNRITQRWTLNVFLKALRYAGFGVAALAPAPAAPNAQLMDETYEEYQQRTGRAPETEGEK